MKNKLFVLTIFLILFAWFKALPTNDSFELPKYAPADLKPTLVHPSLIGKTEHFVPDFSFTNQNGEIVNQKYMDDKIYVANFFFTSCPSICIDLTNNLKIVQNEFKNSEDVFILSHSVDPEIDTTKRLKRYEEINSIDDKNWFLLRGEINEIIRIAQFGYFAIASSDLLIEDSLIHTENFILIDKNRQIRGVYNGTSKLEMSYLIDDIKTLLSN